MTHLPDVPDVPEEPLAGRFRLDAELGRGGMGVVYRAFDLRRGQPVAVKMLHPALTNAFGSARFQSEIQIIQQLRHANIITVLEAGQANGQLYSVMEFLDGETLRERLRREKQLSIEDALWITRCVADGLQYAHDHGVVHRDVKPENIVLSDGRAVLVDFGLARMFDAETADRLTESGIVVGTPHYLSPEQAAAEKHIGPRADQYSLACVVYEMLVGEPPFTGPTATAIAQRHRTDAPVELRHRRKTVSDSLDAAVMQALEKIDTDRFATVREFSAAMHGVVPARRSTPVRQVSGPPVRRRVLTIGAVAGTLLALTALAWRTRGRSDGGPLRHLGAFIGRAADVDSNQVAVAPFTVVDTDTLWHEGLMTLVSNTFEGAGPLHALSVKQGLQRGGQVADVPSAVDFARATRSGLVVFGRLLGVGADSVRLIASLIDARSGESVGDVDIADEANRVPALADTACVRLLRELGAIRPIGAVPTASFGTQSMPALKAFLQGEQLYRQNQWAEAETYYRRAIRDDDRFASAYHRLRNVMRGTRNETDPESFRYALRAAALNHGIAPRDSLLIVADSLYAAMELGPRGPLWWSMLRRRVSILRQAANVYPRDPEVWLELGEALLHYREWLGVTKQSALDAFLRSISRDSTWTPAYFHAIELGAQSLPADSLRELVARNLALDPADARARNLADLLRPGDGAAARWQRLTALDPLALKDLAYTVRFRPDSDETAVRLMRAIDFAHTREKLDPDDSTTVERWRFRMLTIRGHVREAYAHIGSGLAPWSPAEYVRLAMLGVVPAAEARAVLNGWAARGDAMRAALAVPWLFQQADSTALRMLGGRFANAPARDADGAAAIAPYTSAIADAYLALLRRDSVAALRLFDAVPDSLCGGECTTHRLDRARLLRASGRAADALRLLEARPPSADHTGLGEIEWLMERGRAAGAAGQRARADADSALVARYWQHADPTILQLRNTRF